jgi:uncharacterized lipoprotein YmbA
MEQWVSRLQQSLRHMLADAVGDRQQRTSFGGFAAKSERDRYNSDRTIRADNCERVAAAVDGAAARNDH